MARSVYVAASGPDSGKSAVALGIYDQMVRRVGRVAVFRPVVRGAHLTADDPDPLIRLLRDRYPSDAPYERSVGVTAADLHDLDAATGRVVERFRAVERDHEAVLVIGSDFAESAAPVELGINARLAVNLGAPVVGVVSGRRLDPDQLAEAMQVAVDALSRRRCHVLAMVANRIEPDAVQATEAAIARTPGLAAVTVRVVPSEPLLAAPTVRQVFAAAEARVLAGDQERLDRESRGLLVAGMRLPHVLDRLFDGAVAIVPGDRDDVLVGLLAAQQASTFPRLAGVLLNGGFDPEPAVHRLIEALASTLPIALTDSSTFASTEAATRARGALSHGSPRKVEAALTLARLHLDAGGLLDRLDLARADVVTPLMFEHDVVERARAHRRRIVLPEGTEHRVLRAAERVIRQGIADVVLLGDPRQVEAAAAEAEADLAGAAVVDPRERERRERFAVEYARRRAHQGVALDAARDVVVDSSYAGTLMVALGEADGMVSGAAHTTAHTVRPALEIIRAAPGFSVVSSVFFMCLAHRVLVYGD